MPIWEGPRKIFQLVIELPENVKIGSIITVKTNIDMISNITLEVKLDGQVLKGNYEYFDKKEIEEIQIEKLDDLFDERINYISDTEKREELIKQKEDIARELNEAIENNDSNHYTTVSEKYEKVIAELPVDAVYTEKDFDELGEKIKSQLTPDAGFTSYEVDSAVFHGKRFIKNNNISEAKKCMEELREMEARANIFSSPEQMVKVALSTTASIIFSSQMYITRNPMSPLSAEIQKELNICIPTVNRIFEKYEDFSKVTNKDEMKQDAAILIQSTAKLYNLTCAEIPQDNSTQNLFTGLVSKS